MSRIPHCSIAYFCKALPVVDFWAIKSTLIFLIKTAVKIYKCNCEKSRAYCNTLSKTRIKDFLNTDLPKVKYLTWGELILRVLLIFWHKYFNPLVHPFGTSSTVDLFRASSFVMSSVPLSGYWLALLKTARSQNSRSEKRWGGSRLR